METYSKIHYTYTLWTDSAQPFRHVTGERVWVLDKALDLGYPINRRLRYLGYCGLSRYLMCRLNTEYFCSGHCDALLVQLIQVVHRHSTEVTPIPYSNYISTFTVTFVEVISTGGPALRPLRGRIQHYNHLKIEGRVA